MTHWHQYFVVILMLAWGQLAGAHTPLGGLAVAVSPDGKTIAVGGDNRTLYLVDAAQLRIRQRYRLNTTVWGLHFNGASDKLIVEDTDKTLTLINVKTLTTDTSIPRAAYLHAVPKIDMGVTLDDSFRGHVLSLRKLSSLKETKKLTLTVDEKVAGFGLNASGTRLGVILQAQMDKTESNHQRVPRDLRGIDKDIFRQKNDGKSSVIVVFDTKTGKRLSTTRTFYTTRPGARVWFVEDSIMIAASNNINAILSSTGEIRVFKFDHGVNFALGIASDGTQIAIGGLKKGGIYSMNSQGILTTGSRLFELDKLPGWPEYFRGFAFDKDGYIYGSTSGYRLMKLTPQGKIASHLDVY